MTNNNSILSFVIGFIIAIIICFLLIHFNIMDISPKCKTITLQDKIIKSFKNTYEELIKFKNNLLKDKTADKLMKEYEIEYIQFFNDNPEYIQYKIIDPKEITDILDPKFYFQFLIIDILHYKFINENDKKISTMTIEEKNYWLSIRNQMKKYVEQKFMITQMAWRN